MKKFSMTSFIGRSSAAASTVGSSPASSPNRPGTPAVRPAASAPAPVTLAQRDAAHPSRAGRPTILFLDDDARILNSLGTLFRYKYQVFTATNGEQALSILRRYHVHVVVSDQRMPEMTGVEFLRQAKRVSPNTVRILLTGFSDLSAVIDSVNDGEVYRFLNKPWGNQEIQAVIADALAIGLALEAGAEEPAQPPLETPREPAQAERPAVLMLHDKRDTFERMRPLLNETHPFVYAANVEECLDALESRSVGVIVSNLQVGRSDTSELLKQLKQKHPQVLTIVLADSADAEHVIELINQAKIFRYVLSPYKPQKLKFFIDSALNQFQRYRSRPALLREQKVEVAADAPRSKAAAMIGERLRSLRALFVSSTVAR
jgi:serine/threonine-protein kinase